MNNRTGHLRGKSNMGHSMRGTAADNADPVIMFTIEFARNSHIGSAEICLLEAIHKAGSLSQAARYLGISYKHAWLLIDSLKSAFESPVTVAGKGAGVSLTKLGKSLVDRFRKLERDFTQLAAKHLQNIVAKAGDCRSRLFAVPTESK